MSDTKRNIDPFVDHVRLAVEQYQIHGDRRSIEIGIDDRAENFFAADGGAVNVSVPRGAVRSPATAKSASSRSARLAGSPKHNAHLPR